jgi:hypothetical protein
VKALPADARGRADQALFANYAALAATPAPAGPPPEVTVVDGSAARLRESGSCVTLDEGTPAALAVKPPPAGATVANPSATPLTVHARRYADDWSGPARAEVATKTSLTIVLPADRGTAPWRVRATGEAARICALGG